MENMKPVNIVIIDSGVNLEFEELNKIKIQKKYIASCNDNGEVVFEMVNDISDNCGHGTGVTSIIYSYAPTANYYLFKIFDDIDECSEIILIEALKFINNNISCDFINLSCGLEMIESYDELKNVCMELYEKGVILISAFSNDGAVTFPAAFETVIGVDYSLSIFKVTEYYYWANSPINIRGYGYAQRLPTTEGKYCDLFGSSFIVPHIVGQLARECEKLVMSFEDCINYLEEHSIEKKKIKGKYNVEKCFKPEKVVLFPYCKETENIIRNKDDLPFSINCVLDLKYNLKSVTEDINKKNILCEIRSIENFDWTGNDFDTVVIAHINMIERVLKRDLKSELLNKCLFYNKNVIMFDDINFDNAYQNKFKEKDLLFYIPTVTQENIPETMLDKLHIIASPVIGVFGTGPKQGKFNIQKMLKRNLEAIEYKVATLSTEPYAELLGFDMVFPMGYNSTVKICGQQAVQYINYLMSDLDHCNPDLIIVGSQSQTIPTGVGNIGYYAILQHELILGTQPDAYILCVYANDEIEYIKRNIEYLYSINMGDTLAVIVSPFIYEITSGNISNKRQTVEYDILSKKKDNIKKECGIKTFILTETDCIDNIICEIQNYFA